MCMSFSEYVLCYRGYVKKAIKTIWEPIRWNGFFVAKSNGYKGNSISDFWPLATDIEEDAPNFDEMVEAWNLAMERNGV